MDGLRFLAAGNSRKPLKVSRRMLTRILTYHQVMPCFLDFICNFGLSNDAREMRHSGFRELVLLKGTSGGLAIPSLGRSGRQFQLCYNLKSVLPYETGPPARWAVEQTLVHHQFDIEQGTTLWIIVKGDLDLKDRIQSMTGKDGRPRDRAFGTPEECLRSSLVVHLLHGYWSSDYWRWYIQHIEDTIDNEDKVNEIVMVLQANTEVLASLQRFYEALLDNDDFTLKDACRDDIMAFAKQMAEMIHDSSMQIARAKLLVQIVSDRKDLILQHLQGQTTQRMEDLTVSMHQVAVESHKEAIIMRLITVVTLIYLPGTFVSTVFSTDIIRYSDSGEKMFSRDALSLWAQVTVPLSVMTVSIAFLVYKFADRESRRRVSTSRDVENPMASTPGCFRISKGKSG
ncbi:MAG: hypothetical protein Q9168_006473 [Polycauliona sp. 1 TL-2023]